jgi:large subunit ribosomal protein L21
VHAIVQFQGSQYRVQTGEKLQIRHLDAEPGSKVLLDRVLLLAGDSGVQVGRPLVQGASVEAVVLGHERGPKMIIGKFKKRKDYRRRKGYRDDLTILEIGVIHAA